MLKLKKYSKIIPLILIVSILFTACDVPDISKFTEASAEMTKGIRQGVKETGGILETLSKSNISSETAKAAIQENSLNYEKNIAPTLKAIDSLDAYLEALNALALANKKSEENAKALVNSVGNLMTAVSGLQLPETALKLGTVAVTLFNQFKTSRDFKKRVTLVEQIVNGSSPDASQPCTVENYSDISRKLRMSLDALYPEVKAQRVSLEMPLNLQNGVDIETEIAKQEKRLKEINQSLSVEIAPNEEDKLVAEKDVIVKRLKSLRNALERIQKVYDRKTNSLDEKARDEWLEKAGGNFCGVIDIIKLNVDELNNIQQSALILLYSNTDDDNKTLLRYYNNILTNDRRVQSEIGLILDYKNQRERLKELKFRVDDPTLDPNQKKSFEKRKKSVESSVVSTLSDIAVKDDVIKIFVDGKIKESDDLCNSNIKCPKTDNATKERHQQVKLLPVFVDALEAREKVLLAENARLIDELNRVEAQHKSVIDKLDKIKIKQKEMNALFESMNTALDTWGETHASLRLALNTKQILSAARLFSKAKEILEILKKDEEANNS